ncbi:hypothetical protein [Sphaerisporangium album]|uniref:hypothetical protein n=1 Tax=Sphaerisporangium album TaxID=509200 RepID=UPI0015F0E257|nr:hypothetical protein [Sphaerisporangium album]
MAAARWHALAHAARRLGAAALTHRSFLAVLALGAALRAVAMLGYRPAIWFPDSYTYVVTAMRPRPDLVRPAGYSMFLRLLEPFHSFGVVVLVQHLIGLATAVLVYHAVVRAGGRRWAGTLAAAPVLLDAYQIELEHLLVSDALFGLLVAGAVVAALREPTWRTVCAAGLLLAAATLTRTVGLPLIALVTAWLVVRLASGRPPKAGVPREAEIRTREAGVRPPKAPVHAREAEVRPPKAPVRAGDAEAPGAGVRAWVAGVRTWVAGLRWRRLGLAGLLAAVALAPVGAYAAWFSATHHRFGIVGSNGVFLYSRTMAFADCDVMRPPPDLAVLCDPTPPARRPPSQEYIWAAGSPLVALPGITFTEATDRLAGRFAYLAIRSQPADFAASVLSEFARTFTWGRPVYPDREIYGYYEFPVTPPPPPGRYPATVGAGFAERYEQGAIGTWVSEPFAGWMRGYQHVVRLPGTALLAVLLVPPAVAIARTARRGRPAGTHRTAWTAWTLPWATSVALLLIPAVTAQFDYRYVLPAVPLACLAAALAGRGRPWSGAVPTGSCELPVKPRITIFHRISSPR